MLTAGVINAGEVVFDFLQNKQQRPGRNEDSLRSILKAPKDQKLQNQYKINNNRKEISYNQVTSQTFKWLPYPFIHIICQLPSCGVESVTTTAPNPTVHRWAGPAKTGTLAPVSTDRRILSSLHLDMEMEGEEPS